MRICTENMCWQRYQIYVMARGELPALIRCGGGYSVPLTQIQHRNYLCGFALTLPSPTGRGANRPDEKLS